MDSRLSGGWECERGGKAGGQAPRRGRAREFRRGECVTTCCRGGDRVILLLSERVQGGQKQTDRRGERLAV